MSERRAEKAAMCAEPDCDHDWCDDPTTGSWFREEYERAKARNAEIPPHARMIVTNPLLSAHTRSPCVPIPPASTKGENDA